MAHAAGVGHLSLLRATAADAPPANPSAGDAGALDTEHDHRQCVLLGKVGSFGWWLQGFLLLVCFLVLIWKRFTEKVPVSGSSE